MLLAILLAGATLQSPADLGPVPADSVRVYLVRHGQAFSNLDPEPELPPEQLDRLTPLGHAQSRGAAEALKGRGIVAIYTSPAGRARETAAELGKALGMAAELSEPRVGSLKVGKNPKGEDDDWDYRIAEWEAGRDPVPPGGESMAQMGERVRAVVQELAASHKGKSVVIVAHSEVIGAFVGLLQGLAPAKRYPPSVRNGSISAVEASAGALPKLLFANFLSPETAAAK
jgi:probable phosphoglycerate mutase